MKKLSNTKILILFIFISSFAYSESNDMALGIYIGPTISTILYDANVEFIESKVGYAGGFSYENFFSPNISLIGKFGYERKGASLSEYTFVDNNGYPLGITTANENLDYLSATFLFSYSTDWHINIYANIGPYFNFLLSATREFNPQSIPNEDFTEYCNRIDVGVVLGIGMKIPIHEEWDIDLGLNCNYGLLNIDEENQNQSVGQYNTRNLSYSMQFGIKYKF